MSSHLTRRVFRCILANEPINHPGCLAKASYSSIAYRQHGRARARRPLQPSCHLRTAQKRHIFGMNLFQQSSRDDAPVKLEPGIERMMDLEKRARLRARLPSVEEIEDALNAFLYSKKKSLRTIPDTQARLLHQCFQYVFEAYRESAFSPEGDEETRRAFGKDLIRSIWHAAKILSVEDAVITQEHVKLARLLFEEAQNEEWMERVGVQRALATVLCNTGRPEEARHILEQRELSGSGESETDSSGKGQKAGLKAAWRHVIRTFSKQDNETEMFRTIEMTDKYGLSSPRSSNAALVQLYVRRGDASSLEKWFTSWKNADFEDAADDAQTVRSALTFCLENDQIELGHALVRIALAENQTKATWDEVLVWALRLHKSVEEINRMFDIMIEAKIDASSQGRPDIRTVNRLVETAIEANDPYMAERLMGLAQTRGIQPDARTMVLQIEYRLTVGDVDGALTAYKHLLTKDLSSREHIDATNKLIVALCRSKRHDFDTIMNVTADLSDQSASFAPETVKTLCLIHLQRDELSDVTDLLRTYAPGFSSTDRASIQDSILEFCLAKDTPLAQVWDAYNILQSDFDEMNRETRTKIMLIFFQEERPDIAVQIFNHMRRHSRTDTMPTIDTYITVFLECAKLKDVESYGVFHNQLKLDFNIDINTRLRNAMMITLTACDHASEAFTVWDDICDSQEGPSYASLHSIFRACERTPFGDAKARQIWQKLRKNDVHIDDGLWASYVAALAGNGDVEQAISALQAGIDAGEVVPDEMVLGSLYNVSATVGEQQAVKAWVEKSNPGIWQSLLEKGLSTDENGVELLKIDRSVAP